MTQLKIGEAGTFVGQTVITSVLCGKEVHIWEGTTTLCGLNSWRHRFAEVDEPVTCKKCLACSPHFAKLLEDKRQADQEA